MTAAKSSLRTTCFGVVAEVISFRGSPRGPCGLGACHEQAQPCPPLYDQLEILEQRGSLLFWLDRDMGWLAPKAVKPGRPPIFSDADIQFCLMIKVLFGLPLRQMTGWSPASTRWLAWTGRSRTSPRSAVTRRQSRSGFLRAGIRAL